MTVAELIAELSKIEDQDMDVRRNDIWTVSGEQDVEFVEVIEYAGPRYVKLF